MKRLATPAGLATFAVSQVWSTASAVARGLTRAGLLPRRKLAARVISVGNIQVGGAGKTPLVAKIARDGDARGLTVAILLRGYGGDWEELGGLLPPGTQARVIDCGDEAALLRDLAPKAWIGVGARRDQSFDRVALSLGRAPDLVILDDGFQHHAIARDVDVVALTSDSSARVVYRDWESALDTASLVVWTKGETRPDTRSRPAARVRFELADLSAAPPLWLVTGVARPESVVASVEEAGGRIVNHVELEDHVDYDDEMLSSYLAQARAAEADLATTGKDWVKWRERGFSRSDVRVLEPDALVTEGQAEWDKALWG